MAVKPSNLQGSFGLGKLQRILNCTLYSTSGDRLLLFCYPCLWHIVLSFFCTLSLISTEVVSMLSSPGIELLITMAPNSCANILILQDSVIFGSLVIVSLLSAICCTDTFLVEIGLAITAVMFWWYPRPTHWMYAPKTQVVGVSTLVSLMKMRIHMYTSLWDCRALRQFQICKTKFYFTDWLDSHGCHTLFPFLLHTTDYLSSAKKKTKYLQAYTK